MCEPAGRLFVVSGPSGAGKGTLVANVRRVLDGLALTVSVTTRPKRPGDKDGLTYHFVDESVFLELIAEGKLLEWACVHGKYYGTLLSEVQEFTRQGLDIILEIDVQGAMQIHGLYPQAVLIFIEPPSLEILERRLRGRGTDDEEVIKQRLANAAMELSYKERYNAVVINDDLEQATNELLRLIEENRLR